MKLPIVASLIILVAMLALRIRYLNRADEKSLAAYMKREEEANNVRKRSLEDLDYVKIDQNKLPMTTLKDDPEIAAIHKNTDCIVLRPKDLGRSIRSRRQCRFCLASRYDVGFEHISLL